MSAYSHLRVEPHSNVSLKRFDPNETRGLHSKDEAVAALQDHTGRLRRLQELLYAEGKHCVLVVLQAMDAAGKDGTIRHVFNSFNPLGTNVTSFKVPTAEELGHDFLWRIHKAAPKKGEISIFNRSHYEDVLVARVHGLASNKIIERRYEHINNFEALLADSGVTIRKFFLHISRKEQEARFHERETHPDKIWKLSPSDRAESELWDDYQETYEIALSRTSTEHAPWYVVPANHKWFRNAVVSAVLVEALEALNMHFPKAEDQHAA